MAAPQITPLPTPPTRSSPADFSNRADAFLGALPNLQAQVNEAATFIDGKAAQAGASATAAEAAKVAAAGSASAATAQGHDNLAG
ncbi:hypothetical protein ACEYYB_11425 [Paracoccus sp. p4-l81]|uniref:hypothetical protein n=1 Tax=Paracoccus sp. p4-l81 TaxID=3342806 RepID=UPI0035B9185A